MNDKYQVGQKGFLTGENRKGIKVRESGICPSREQAEAMILKRTC